MTALQVFQQAEVTSSDWQCSHAVHAAMLLQPVPKSLPTTNQQPTYLKP